MSPFLNYNTVKIIGLPFVTTTVCSYWATRLPSGVRRVQPSLSSLTNSALEEIKPSIAMTIPSRSLLLSSGL